MTFIESFALLFLIITVLAIIVKIFRQPIIIGYILAGFAMAQFLGNAVNISGEYIMSLADIGIMFLLFLMGLELNLSSLRFLGKSLITATAIQSAIFFTIGSGLAALFGMRGLQLVYIGILFMFSSTIVVAKWLDDKKETGELHGKVILGISIIQDIIALIIITILSVVKEQSWINIGLAPIKGIILVGIAILLARYGLNKILKFSSKYPELLFIISLGVCFLFVLLAPVLGYSATIGAFIAGVTLANTIYKTEILSKLKPLIVFFNMLFFVGMGFQINTGIPISDIILILVLTVLAIVLRPIIFFFTLRQQKFDNKISVQAGLYLSSLSEFGMIIITAGIAEGLIPAKIGALSVIPIVISMITSSYFIKYNKNIFAKLEGILPIAKSELKGELKKIEDYHVLFFGYYDIGKSAFEKLESQGKKILVIENDPENIELLKKDGIKYAYNSIRNPEFFNTINFTTVELVVSSIMDVEDNKLILKHLKKENSNAKCIVTAKNVKDSLALYNAEADYVICPTYLNEQKVSVLLEEYTTDFNKIIDEKIIELAKFKEKKEKIPEETFLDIDAFFKKIEKKN